MVGGGGGAGKGKVQGRGSMHVAAFMANVQMVHGAKPAYPDGGSIELSHVIASVQ